MWQVTGAGVLTLTLASQEEQRSRDTSPVLAPTLPCSAGVGETLPASSFPGLVSAFEEFKWQYWHLVIQQGSG